MGETVSVKTRAGAEHGPRRVRGVVTAADDDGFDLTLDDATAQRVEYADLTQAHTVFEWGDAESSKTGKSNSKSGSKKSAAPKRSNSRREPVRR